MNLIPVHQFQVAAILTAFLGDDQSQPLSGTVWTTIMPWTVRLGRFYAAAIAQYVTLEDVEILSIRDSTVHGYRK
ncbi:hypothetical protein [Sodalinema gerasimenkoae]|uniref:hypothetical protein n=1 Tax=Sodalinema gerasimenkoae TaxID=2862348 RepID=UPI00135AE6F3|nr:hypothetical protein [Sodalinema gerasimenkoae]